MNIWQDCRAHEYRSHLFVEAWRVVETQSISSSRKIVDSLLEHEILENEIEQKSKPSLKKECQYNHYLLATAFRYPPLKYGSRFGKNTEPSLWYGSLTLNTALIETAFYRFVLLAGSEIRDFKTPIPKTAFNIHIKTLHGLDLTKKPFSEYIRHISSPTDWSASQLLGSNMRKHLIQAFTYVSARTQKQDAINCGVFTCNAFAQKNPLSQKSLDQFVTKSEVEFFDKETKDKYSFKREDFMIDGQIPFPPR